jgi:hypothetical protein
MAWEKISTFVFGFIASVAGVLYIEEWYRKKYREGIASNSSLRA